MQTLAEIRSLLQTKVASSDDRRMILDMARKYVKDGRDVKDDYLMALLFPEFAANVRIPSPFGLPSALHTQKQEIYLSTSASGSGMVIFTPCDLHWNMLYASAVVPTGAGGMGNYVVDGNNVNLYCPNTFSQRYLPNMFSHARIVGCSLRVSYIGQDDDESGFIVGSQIQNQNITGITDRDIEEGYHVKRVRPREGLRMSYTPMDDKDFQYTELNTRVVFDSALSALATRRADFPNQVFSGVPQFMLLPSDLMMSYATITGTTSGEDPTANALQVQVRVLAEAPQTATGLAGVHNFEFEYGASGMNDVTVNQVGWVDVATAAGDFSIAPAFHPVNFIGQGPRAGHVTAQMPQILAFYYKGLPVSTQCLRVDVIRHLECIPRSEQRNYMNCERPVFCDSTQKLATQIQHKQSNLQVSNLRDVPRMIAATNAILVNTNSVEEVLENVPAIDQTQMYSQIAARDPSYFDRMVDSATRVMGFLGSPEIGSTVGGYFGGAPGYLAGGLIGGTMQAIAGSTTQPYSAPMTQNPGSNAGGYTRAPLQLTY